MKKTIAVALLLTLAVSGNAQTQRHHSRTTITRRIPLQTIWRELRAAEDRAERLAIKKFSGKDTAARRDYEDAIYCAAEDRIARKYGLTQKQLGKIKRAAVQTAAA